MTGITFSSMQQQTPQACLLNTVPPTGGIIASLNNNVDGSITATWTPAVGLSAPFRYELYVKKANAEDLFNVNNIVAVVYDLSFDFFKDGLGLPVSRGEAYHVGVVAVDDEGNRNDNETSLSITASGLEYYNLIDAFHVPACQNIEVEIMQESIEIEIDC